MPKLIYAVNGLVLREYPLEQGEFHFGRSSNNDIQFDDISVSGRHGKVTVVKSAYMDNLLECRLEDLGSTNGTYVNGKSISNAYLLKNHDRIQIGQYELRFVDEQNVDTASTRIMIRD